MKAAKIGKILLLRNRGILLDICVFILNILLIRLLTGNFIELTRASNEDVWAKLAVALFFTGLLFLAPLGAILKKYQFWDRIDGSDKEKQVAKNIRLFIFSPWFCFVWLLIIYAFVVVSWHQVLLRDSYLSSVWAILAIFFGGMLYCFVGAVVISNFYEDGYGTTFWELRVKGSVYELSDFSIDGLRYLFDLPVFDRFRKFLETPPAAALGDLCIFLNMICFQVFWNYLFSNLHSPGEFKDGVEIFSAVFVYLLLLCLFYFPPRNFYLAEDIHRPIVWLTILLANLPPLLYFFFGVRIF